MNTLNRVVLLVSFFVIASCGGGGGGGGSEDSYTPPAQTNGAPTITNTVFNISVQENQTSAFTISASLFSSGFKSGCICFIIFL